MNKNLLGIRLFFLLLSGLTGGLACRYTLGLPSAVWAGAFVGVSIAFFVVALDLIFKGFSLRGFSSVAFGLFLGWLVAKLLVISPLLAGGHGDTFYLVKLSLYLVFMYWGTVLALKAKDDFNFVIPFVRFTAQDMAEGLVVVDASVLMDGRIVGLYSTRFMHGALVVPQFVLDELHRLADSDEPARRARGRKGLDTLNKLKKLPYVDLRVNDMEVQRGQTMDDRLIFLAHSLQARLFTLDYNTVRLAEFNGVNCLNLGALAQVLHAEVAVGDIFELALVKPGKEPHQAVGFLGDGSMVVVDHGRESLGQTVSVEVTSILPSSGGRMIFAQMRAA
jgi:uncharacterized protein YacL